MTRRAGAAHEPAAHESECITCGDLARRMRVLEVDVPRSLALCLEDGRRETVYTGIVEGVAVGDTLLVHAGTALHREGPGGREGRGPA
jgi:hypothetical protein